MRFFCVWRILLDSLSHRWVLSFSPSSTSSHEAAASQVEPPSAQSLDSQGHPLPLPQGNSSNRRPGTAPPLSHQPPTATTAGQRLSELDRLSADAALRARHETAKSLPIAVNPSGSSGGGNGNHGSSQPPYHHPPTTPMASSAAGGGAGAATGRSTVGAALERRRNAAAAAAAAAAATGNNSSSSSSSDSSGGAVSPYNNNNGNGSSSSNNGNHVEALRDAQKAFQWLSARTSFAGKGLDHSSGQGAGTVQLMAPGVTTRQLPLWATSTLSVLKSIYPEVKLLFVCLFVCLFMFSSSNF